MAVAASQTWIRPADRALFPAWPAGSVRLADQRTCRALRL